MQLTAFCIQDMTSVVESCAANLLIADCGRYNTDPVYIAQSDKLVAGLKQAVRWYEEGNVRAIVTQVVPFGPHQRQPATRRLAVQSCSPSWRSPCDGS